MRIRATLFNSGEVFADGRRVLLPYKKAEALLLYLLVQKRASRRELIGLLWPDTDDETAYKNLRHAVYSVRKAFPEEPFSPGLRSELSFSPDHTVETDLDLFSAGATDAYTGPFLAGYSLPRAEGFEDWVRETRDSFRSTYLDRLFSDAQECFSAGDCRTARELCEKFMETDPLEENVALLMMKIYREEKRYRKAIGVYLNFSKRLSEEFGVAPLKETTDLYYAIANEWNGSSSLQPQKPDEELIGKDHAYRRLFALCNRMQAASDPGFCLVSGEAGVGKTYLLDYMFRQFDLSDGIVIRVRCFYSEMSSSFAPWHTVMTSVASELSMRHIEVSPGCRQMAGRLFPCLCMEGPAVSSELSEEINYGTDHSMACEGVLSLFSQILHAAPLLLVFEDIHWMDPDSIDLLKLLVHRVKRPGLAVICTSRTEMPEKNRVFLEQARADQLLKTLTLSNFTAEQTEAFVRSALPQHTFPRPVLDEIFQDTDGNPLLLSYLANTLQETCRDRYVSLDADMIIDSRLKGLSHDEMQVLEAVCVFQENALFETLSSILTKEPLELMYLCNSLCTRAILEEDAENGRLAFGFTHARLKQHLKQQISETKARILHLRIAQYLESQLVYPDAHAYDTLIHHYAGGGNGYKALEYRVKALSLYGARCYELFPQLSEDREPPSYGEEGMLSYFASLEKELERLKGLPSGREREALEHTEKRLLYAKSRYCIRCGLYEEGLLRLDRLCRLCEGMTAAEDREFLAKAHLQYIFYAVQTYDRAVMLDHLDKGSALVEGRESPDAASLLRLRGLYALMLGNNDEARAWEERSIEMFSRLEQDAPGRYSVTIAGAYNYIAESWRLDKEYGKAFPYYEKAIGKYSKGTEYQPGAAILYTDYAVAAFQSGQLRKARELFMTADGLYRSFHEISQRPIALSYLARFFAEDGDYSRAAGLLREGRELCQAVRSPWWTGELAYNSYRIRELLESRGDRFAALEALWPESKKEHCLWCLSNLRQLEPREETEQMEAVLPTL